MNLEQHFAGLLDSHQPDLALSEQTWDRRADEVSQFTVSEADVALQTILQHHELGGQAVLEISFGGGRHLLEFARRGARVSGVEISANMLRHTQAKLQAAGLSDQVDSLLHSSWEAVDLQQQGWEGAFDLVFLYMSPALSSTVMLRKALAASRSGFYVCSHAHREDALLGELQDELGLERRPVGSKSADSLYNLFNLLYQWGYFPQLTFEERSSTSGHDPDYILQRYASWLWREGASDEQCQQLLQLLESKAEGGKVSSRSRDLVGHLYLDKRMRR